MGTRLRIFRTCCFILIVPCPAFSLFRFASSLSPYVRLGPGVSLPLHIPSLPSVYILYSFPFVCCQVICLSCIKLMYSMSMSQYQVSGFLFPVFSLVQFSHFILVFVLLFVCCSPLSNKHPTLSWYQVLFLLGPTSTFTRSASTHLAGLILFFGQNSTFTYLNTVFFVVVFFRLLKLTKP